jgi:hypothetical protein
MIEMIQYPENYIRMAGAARRAAQKKHDVPTIVGQLLTAYSEILRDHSGQKSGNHTVRQPLSVTGDL